jgi:hypothetical protein
MLNRKISVIVILVAIFSITIITISIYAKNTRSIKSKELPEVAQQIADELRKDQELRLHFWKEGETIVVAYVNGTLFEKEFNMNQNSPAITEIKQLLEKGTPVAFTFMKDSAIIASIISNISNSNQALWGSPESPWQLVLVKVLENTEPHTGIRNTEAHCWINEPLAECVYNAYLKSKQ